MIYPLGVNSVWWFAYFVGQIFKALARGTLSSQHLYSVSPIVLQGARQALAKRNACLSSIDFSWESTDTVL